MKIIIAGVGKLGSYLAKLLVSEKHEITLIDKSFIGKDALINNEEVNYIEGNALDSNILIESGIANADLLISVMKSDSENIMCSLIGKKLGVTHTIARIRTQEYLNSINILKDTLGLSMLINPEQLTATHIAQTLSIPSALEATSFFKGRMDLISLRIKENSNLDGITVSALSNKLKRNVMICAIERNEEIIIPKGDTIFHIGDKIHITGKRNDVNVFLKYTDLISEKTKKVIVSGGSGISVYLCNMLTEMGMNVKLIEKDSLRCKILCEAIPDTLIINGDVSNQNVLYEEGIKSCDAFVALTNSDEENIVYSMFASSVEVPKIITKVNHISLDGVTKKANIDTVITPHKIAGDQVVQYIRAIEKSGSSSCESIYNFAEDNFEILEFKVRDDFKGLGKYIKDLDFKGEILIAAILRGKCIIYPGGRDEIKTNDVILVVNKDKSLRELNDMVK